MSPEVWMLIYFLVSRSVSLFIYGWWTGSQPEPVPGSHISAAILIVIALEVMICLGGPIFLISMIMESGRRARIMTENASLNVTTRVSHSASGDRQGALSLTDTDNSK